MQRHTIAPRPDWRDRVERMGLLFHTTPDGTETGATYWDESAYYEFEESEIEELESATEELHARCLDAVEHVVTTGRYSDLGISPEVGSAIEASWRSKDAALYGRFDLAYGTGQAPKMLEYNADTPTSLLEAAVIQWHWLQDTFPNEDQFNSIWEGLVETWKSLKSTRQLKGLQVHFASVDELEDAMTVAVLRDTAEESGIPTTGLGIEEIGWDSGSKFFVDLSGNRMWSIFKLYPWEWMVNEDFGKLAMDRTNETQWIEPIWKMVLSNKGILPILWELFPNHPNLLPAFNDGPRHLTNYVTKPRLGREGANVAIHASTGNVYMDGPYGDTGTVYQALANLPNFDGLHCVIGSWVIGKEARGIGVRESTGPITDNLSRFVPHLFRL